MKPLLIFVALAGVAFLPLSSHGQQSCGQAAVLESVEVAPGELSLADLLAPGACPALLRAAARLQLGRAPLLGSARVLEGGELQARVRKFAGDSHTMGLSAAGIPQRITVRRAGPRASCASLSERLLALVQASRMRLPAALAGTQPPAEMPSRFDADCGGEGRIPRDALLEVVKTSFDPALASWDISARCVHPADCVPFVVRLRDADAAGLGFVPAKEQLGFRFNPARSTSFALTEPGPASAPLLVRPGETAILFWDRAGIRLVIPVVCLDRGQPGEAVRARIPRGGRVVRAVVVGRGVLRAAS